MTAPVDHLIVRLDKAFEDEIIFESGVRLFKYTGLEEEWNATATGKVISVPRRLSDRLELKGLKIEALEGDEVIFNYLVVCQMLRRDRDTPLHRNLFYHEGQFYWKVDYYSVFGFIRQGKIVPAMDFVFCEPLPETFKPKEGLIYLPESTREKPKGKARVLAVGNPKEGEPELSLKEGEIIRYSEKYALHYQIKGRPYIILHQSRVLAKQLT